jgi:hypothetical protein
MLLVSFRTTLAHILPRMHPRGLGGGGTTSWPVIETYGQPVTVRLTTGSTRYTLGIEAMTSRGTVDEASLLTASRCEMGDSEGRVKLHTCSATFPDIARPFLSDRECPPRISPIDDGVDGILNVKPMKANSWQRGWSYVEVMDVLDVKVVEVVVEDEERRWCSSTLVHLLYVFWRDGADIECCLY